MLGTIGFAAKDFMTQATDVHDEKQGSPSPTTQDSGEVKALKKGKAPAPRRYVVTLYARATEEEKRRIERLAADAGLSVSRYLVRAAAEERLPPNREERARLESLLYRFKRASLFLDHLVTSATGIDRAGGAVPKPDEVREAARLLASLANELKRRL